MEREVRMLDKDAPEDSGDGVGDIPAGSGLPDPVRARGTPCPFPLGGRTILTIEEAAKVLGIGKAATYQAAGAGQIPTLRLGRRLYVPTVRLLTLLGFNEEIPA